MNPNKYQALSNYLQFLTERYHIQLCFNDFTGFITIDSDLDRALRPYMAHTNPYCMYVKSERTLFNRCLALKKPIAEKSVRLNRTFYGICHAGVGEFITPIYCREMFIGVINTGVFQDESRRAAYLIRNLCRKTGLDQERVTQLYYDSLRPEAPDIDTVAALLEFVADYLGNTCLNLLATNAGLNLGAKRRYHSSEDTILAHLLEYIRLNYAEPLNDSKIAAFCHCSESYLNHLFKKRVGINIKLYINKIRIEHAQTELTGSDLKIAAVALKVGFNDPNYFSRVFTAVTGISPLEYRRRFSRTYQT